MINKLRNFAANLSVAGSAAFAGYGNFYKTQTFITMPDSSTCWCDVTGNAYDAADRPLSRFEYTPGNGASSVPNGTLGKSTYSYDAPQQAGYLSSAIDALGNKMSLTFDGRGKLVGKSFVDKAVTTESITPNISYGYDADGRIASASSSASSDSYVYDANGNVLSHTEGGGGAVDNPTISYAYYANGWRKSLSIQGGAAFSNPEFKYNYQTDGFRRSVYVSGHANPFAWTYTGAGRLQTQSDPQTGNPISGAGANLVAKTQTYDINEASAASRTGELTSITFPSHAQYSSIVHDA